MAIKDKDPVESWDFNNTRVGKVNGTELVCSGPDRYVQGKKGKGWSFDGTTASVLTAPFSGFLIQAESSISWSFWMKYTTIGDITSRNLLEFARADSIATGYHQASLSGGQAIHRGISVGRTLQSAPFGVNLVDWIFVGVTFDKPTGAYKMVINDTTAASGTGWTQLSGDVATVAVGSDYDKASAWAFEVDSLMVWDVGLTDEELAELYNDGDGLEYPFLAWGSVNDDGIVYNSNEIYNLQNPGGAEGKGWLKRTVHGSQIEQPLVETVPDGRFRNVRYNSGDSS